MVGVAPEKVLFGSDAYSDANTPLSDYEEKQWLMTDKARPCACNLHSQACWAMVRSLESVPKRSLTWLMRDSSLALYRLN